MSVLEYILDKQGENSLSTGTLVYPLVKTPRSLQAFGAAYRDRAKIQLDAHQNLTSDAHYTDMLAMCALMMAANHLACSSDNRC